jgi:hypothetical protein
MSNKRNNKLKKRLRNNNRKKNPMTYVPISEEKVRKAYAEAGIEVRRKSKLHLASNTPQGMKTIKELEERTKDNFKLPPMGEEAAKNLDRVFKEEFDRTQCIAPTNIEKILEEEKVKIENLEFAPLTNDMKEELKAKNKDAKNN